MKKVLAVAALVCLAGYSGAARADQEVVVAITDKSGANYSLIRVWGLKDGISFTDYKFAPDDKREDQITVYSGAQDGEKGRCHRAEVLGLEKALINDRLVVKDLDGDGWNDVGLRVTEAECKKSGKTIRLERNLYATDTGFRIEEVTK